MAAHGASAFPRAVRSGAKTRRLGPRGLARVTMINAQVPARRGGVRPAGALVHRDPYRAADRSDNTGPRPGPCHPRRDRRRKALPRRRTAAPMARGGTDDRRHARLESFCQTDAEQIAGDPGRIRTCNLPLRRGLLYPVEPRGRLIAS